MFECRPPPRDVPGVVDQTRGLLYYVEENCPGAFHAPDVKYVCIAGRYKSLTAVKLHKCYELGLKLLKPRNVCRVISSYFGFKVQCCI